jgi:hypothetical protein
VHDSVEDSNWIPDLFTMAITTATQVTIKVNTIALVQAPSRLRTWSSCCVLLITGLSRESVQVWSGPWKLNCRLTHQKPRNPGYCCWLCILKDLLSRLLGMAQLYPGYDCKQFYNCCLLRTCHNIVQSPFKVEDHLLYPICISLLNIFWQLLSLSRGHLHQYLRTSCAMPARDLS